LGSNNLLLNNDSHQNRDLRGDMLTAFQVSTTGSGSLSRGNRAWNNSDDGYDFFNASVAPILRILPVGQV